VARVGPDEFARWRMIFVYEDQRDRHREDFVQAQLAYLVWSLLTRVGAVFGAKDPPMSFNDFLYYQDAKNVYRVRTRARTREEASRKSRRIWAAALGCPAMLED